MLPALIISSGFHELIEPVLEHEGLFDAVELRANSVEPRPDGWRAHFRVAGRCEACGEPCKRADLPTGVEVVYAGDSTPTSVPRSPPTACLQPRTSPGG